MKLHNYLIGKTKTYLQDRQCSEQVKYSSGNGFNVILDISPENFWLKTFNALNMTAGVRAERTVELVR